MTLYNGYIQLPTPDELRHHQVAHYTRRLAEATDPQARRFLRSELYKLKTYGNPIRIIGNYFNNCRLSVPENL